MESFIKRTFSYMSADSSSLLLKFIELVPVVKNFSFFTTSNTFHFSVESLFRKPHRCRSFCIFVLSGISKQSDLCILKTITRKGMLPISFSRILLLSNYGAPFQSWFQVCEHQIQLLSNSQNCQLIFWIFDVFSLPFCMHHHHYKIKEFLNWVLPYMVLQCSKNFFLRTESIWKPYIYIHPISISSEPCILEHFFSVFASSRDTQKLYLSLLKINSSFCIRSLDWPQLDNSNNSANPNKSPSD